MRLLRTPNARFEHLPDFPFQPRYVEVEGIRIHYVDEGPRQAPPVLLLHGEPTWSYLYRHMIFRLARVGLRAVAPDLPGFGRSDKPARREDYSYPALVRWMTGWLEAVDLEDVTLFGQDWGSLVGLRLAAEQPRRFARVVVANGALPTGSRSPPLAFRAWRAFARWTPRFPVGRIVQLGTVRTLTPDELAAYEAPFPDEAFKAGARALPGLVPARPGDPGAAENRAAWRLLEEWQKPFLTVFSDRDPMTRGLDRPFRERVPGARGQPHSTLEGAGHFLQEDRGSELAEIVAVFAGGG